MFTWEFNLALLDLANDLTAVTELASNRFHFPSTPTSNLITFTGGVLSGMTGMAFPRGSFCFPTSQKQEAGKSFLRMARGAKKEFGK